MIHRDQFDAKYQFSEVESQSRMEVARAMAEIREAKIERDKAYKELHATQMESQSWKQEVVTTKAAVRLFVLLILIIVQLTHPISHH